MSELARIATLSPYTPNDELEADQIGLELMAQAGFDPREAVTLWQTMARSVPSQMPPLLSTHPAGSDRLEALLTLLPRAVTVYRLALSKGMNLRC